MGTFVLLRQKRHFDILFWYNAKTLVECPNGFGSLKAG